MRRFPPAVMLAGAFLSCATEPEPPLALPAFLAGEYAAQDSLFQSALFYSMGGRAVFADWVYTAAASTSAGAAAPPALADSVRGRTFVFDCQTLRYVRHPEATGAPPDGVRLVLYMDDDSGQPICPLELLAFMDVTPADTGGAPAARVEVVDLYGRAVYARYIVWNAALDGGTAVGVNGWFTNGRQHFAIDSRSRSAFRNGADSISLTHVETGARFEVRSWEVDSVSRVVEHELWIILDGEVVRARGHERWLSNPVLEVQIEVDGRPFGSFACCAGDSATVTVPDGRAPTAIERSLLERLGRGSQGLYLLHWRFGFPVLYLVNPPDVPAPARDRVAVSPVLRRPAPPGVGRG